ncbi:MAG: TorF family putative porin, partial [Alphaproteobacteria bacterium]
NGHVGHQSIDNNAAFGTPDYVDFSGGVSVELVKSVSLSVAYIGTDMSDSECPDACDQVVATLAASF